MDSRKNWKKTVDSGHEVPLFPEGWAPKAKRVDSDIDDDHQQQRVDSDDNDDGAAQARRAAQERALACKAHS